MDGRHRGHGGTSHARGYVPVRHAGVGEMSAAMTLDKTVEGLVRDMALLREAQPAEFSATLSQVLQKRSAPMLLLRADKLEALGRLPVYAEVEVGG